MGAVPFFDEAFSGGHLLVVQGDLTALAVDAVVIPCDSQGNAHEGFLPLLGSVEPSTYLPGFARVPAFADRGDGLEGPVRLAGVDGRQVWLIDTTARTHGTAATLVAAVGNAIEQVGAALGPGMTVALPLPGVGDGGFGSTYFSVISALIPELEERAAHLDLDMVLTVRARSDYAAVQHFRRDSARHAQTPTAAAADVTGGATRVLEGLARFAREGRLVPFLGAGASVGAGAPSWWGLLEDLARTAGIAEEHIPSLQQLDARDAATVIARIGRRDSPDSDADDSDQLHSIRTAIVERLAGDTYTVTQGLIAGLAVPEAITTNYDRQYEIANTHTSSTDPSRTFDVLPHVRPRLGSPWLMKIHGDVAHPESIVISRDDYLRFDRESGPAAGVLQSRMLTGHLLFIGYSMSDEDIVRLARDVQRYREAFTFHDVHQPVGTVLEVAPNPLRHQLWDGILDFVTFAPQSASPPSGGDAQSTQRAARWLRVFLDLLARQSCSDVPYLLDPTYRDLVTHGGSASEKADELLESLAHLAQSVNAIDEAADSPGSGVQVAAQRAREMLSEMGLRVDQPE